MTCWQKLFDYLLISLRGSVVNQYNAIDGFTGKSMDDLHQVPQTIEEMGEVNEKYQSIMSEKPKVIGYNILSLLCCKHLRDVSK